MTTLGGITLLFDQSPASLGAEVATLGDTSGIVPIMLLALSTVAAGVVGRLIGPILGGAVFRFVKRNVFGEIAVVREDRCYKLQHSLFP